MISANLEPHSAGLVANKGAKLLSDEHIDEKSTALNTHAVSSEDGSVEDAPVELLEDFEWRGLTWPEKDILDLTVDQYG